MLNFVFVHVSLRAPMFVDVVCGLVKGVEGVRCAKHDHLHVVEYGSRQSLFAPSAATRRGILRGFRKVLGLCDFDPAGPPHRRQLRAVEAPRRRAPVGRAATSRGLAVRNSWLVPFGEDDG